MRDLELKAVPVGLSFANVTVAAGSVVQLIAPSANINGVILRTVVLGVTGNTGDIGCALYADTTAPTSGDSTKRIIFGIATIGTGAITNAAPYPLFLYPGLGLWVNVGVGGTAVAQVSYDLLPPVGN